MIYQQKNKYMTFNNFSQNKRIWSSDLKDQEPNNLAMEKAQGSRS